MEKKDSQAARDLLQIINTIRDGGTLNHKDQLFLYNLVKKVVSGKVRGKFDQDDAIQYFFIKSLFPRIATFAVALSKLDTTEQVKYIGRSVIYSCNSWLRAKKRIMNKEFGTGEQVEPDSEKIIKPEDLKNYKDILVYRLIIDKVLPKLGSICIEIVYKSVILEWTIQKIKETADNSKEFYNQKKRDCLKLLGELLGNVGLTGVDYEELQICLPVALDHFYFKLQTESR